MLSLSALADGHIVVAVFRVEPRDREMRRLDQPPALLVVEVDVAAACGAAA